MALGDLDPRWKNPQGSDPQQMYLWAQDLIKELRRGEYLTNAIGGGVPNSQLADMPPWTLKARNNAATGDPQDVAAGDITITSSPLTAPHVLGWNASNEFRRIATGALGGLHLLASGTVTNQATLDIVLTAFTAYRGLQFVLQLLPASDAVSLRCRLSTNGGSSYDAGANDYDYRSLTLSSVSVLTTDDGNDSIIMSAANTIGNGAAEGWTGIARLLNQANAALRPTVDWQATYKESTAGIRAFPIFGSGSRLTAQDTDAVQFSFSGGNIASGTWAVYGFA